MSRGNISNQILDLQGEITQTIDKYISSTHRVSDFDHIQAKLKDIITQGTFWIQQENPHRFIYDLKQFLKWVKEFTGDSAP